MSIAYVVINHNYYCDPAERIIAGFSSRDDAEAFVEKFVVANAEFDREFESYRHEHWKRTKAWIKSTGVDKRGFTLRETEEYGYLLRKMYQCLHASGPDSNKSGWEYESLAKDIKKAFKVKDPMPKYPATPEQPDMYDVSYTIVEVEIK